MTTRRLTFYRRVAAAGILVDAVNDALAAFGTRGPVQWAIVAQEADHVDVEFTYADGYDAWPDSQRLSQLMGQVGIDARA